MTRYDIGGGGPRICQFIHGFPIVGDLGRTGVFPRKETLCHAPGPSLIWAGNSTRFQTRARASGGLIARVLWGDAMGQVTKGWLGTPLPIDKAGNVATFWRGGTVISYRAGVGQKGEIAALRRP